MYARGMQFAAHVRKDELMFYRQSGDIYIDFMGWYAMHIEQ